MKIETPLLKKLGPVPFWRGGEKCLDSLEMMYRRAAERANRVLQKTTPAGRGDSQSDSSMAMPIPIPR